MPENIVQQCSEMSSSSLPIEFNQKQDYIDEDFFNALDVLRCFLSPKHYGIITELESSFELKSNAVQQAYEHGFESGLNSKR